MFGLKVPIISIVIGEGGSGGALAIGCANKLLMLENAVFYVARYFEFFLTTFALTLDLCEDLLLDICCFIFLKGGSACISALENIYPQSHS